MYFLFCRYETVDRSHRPPRYALPPCERRGPPETPHVPRGRAHSPQTTSPPLHEQPPPRLHSSVGPHKQNPTQIKSESKTSQPATSVSLDMPPPRRILKELNIEPPPPLNPHASHCKKTAALILNPPLTQYLPKNTTNARGAQPGPSCAAPSRL